MLCGACCSSPSQLTGVAAGLVANDDTPLSVWASRFVADGERRYNFTGNRKIGVRQVPPLAGHKSDHKPFWMAIPVKYPRGATINDVVWTEARFYVRREQAIASAVMGPQCKMPLAGNSKLPLVLDVGANTGYFSLLAAACGCRAMAFEPRTDMASFIQLSARFNGFGPNQLALYNKLVTHEKNVKFDGWNAVSTAETLSGRAASGRGCRKGSKCATEAAAKDARMASFSENAVAIDELVSEDVLYLKVDVEGHEPSALRSARSLIQEHTVHYILFEITHYLFGAFTTGKYIKVLQWLDQRGYTLHHVETANFLMDEKSAKLPTGSAALATWMGLKAKGCNTQAATFCQAGNIFAVHPKARWPLRRTRIE